MKTRFSVVFLGSGVAAVLLAGALMALAQQPKRPSGAEAGYGKGAAAAGAAAAGGEIIRVRKMEGLGKRGYVKTPEFDARTSLSKGAKPAQDWVQILVEYDTEPKWIDELTFQFYALGETTEEGKKAYSFYQLTTRFSDIERGRGHLASAYLRPQAVKRYGEIVALAVEISHEGKVVAEQTETSGVKMPPKWWKDQTIIGNKDVTARPGYLLDKNQSPFALVNIDDFEVSK